MAASRALCDGFTDAFSEAPSADTIIGIVGDIKENGLGVMGGRDAMVVPALQINIIDYLQKAISINYKYVVQVST